MHFMQLLTAKTPVDARELLVDVVGGSALLASEASTRRQVTAAACHSPILTNLMLLSIRRLMKAVTALALRVSGYVTSAHRTPDRH